MILGPVVHCCLGTTHTEMPKLLLAGVYSANPVLLLAVATAGWAQSLCLSPQGPKSPSGPWQHLGTDF